MIKFDSMVLRPDFYQMPIYVCNDIYLITIYEKKLKGILWRLRHFLIHLLKNEQYIFKKMVLRSFILLISIFLKVYKSMNLKCRIYILVAQFIDLFFN